MKSSLANHTEGKTVRTTVGYGHVILPNEGNKYDSGIDETAAVELVLSDLDRVVYPYLNSWLKNNSVSLNQQQYDALVDFTFTAGQKWITDFWGLRNILLSGNITYQAMHSEFMTWTKVGGERSLGMYRRRMDELNIFFYGDYSRNSPDWPYGGV